MADFVTSSQVHQPAHYFQNFLQIFVADASHTNTNWQTEKENSYVQKHLTE